MIEYAGDNAVEWSFADGEDARAAGEAFVWSGLADAKPPLSDEEWTQVVDAVAARSPDDLGSVLRELVPARLRRPLVEFCRARERLSAHLYLRLRRLCP